NTAKLKRWGFGAAYPPSGTPVAETDSTFANVGGIVCGPVLSYIFNHPCTVTLYSGGTIVQQVKYTYNASGHPTQTQTLVSGSKYLTSSASYNPNGTIASVTDVNNATTNYYYDGTEGCNSLLLTSIVQPVNSLTTAQAWDCNGGVPTSSTDANKQITKYGFVNQSGAADPLWRRRSITDPGNNITWAVYSPGGVLPETVETILSVSSSSSMDKLTTLDGLGRPYLQQTKQSPTSTTFDTVVTSY